MTDEENCPQAVKHDFRIRNELNPVRAEGLGRNEGFRVFSQAVRPAGKRFRESADAEVFMADDQLVAGERALGIEAEMIFGMGRMRYARTCKEVFVGAYRIRPTAMDAKNHCSVKPDGAADL